MMIDDRGEGPGGSHVDVEYWEEIARRVESCGGVWKTSMRDLRNASGNVRSGPHVRARIGMALMAQGLAHYPEELPRYQHELVWVYPHDSPFAQRIRAVLDPSEETAGELRQWMDAETILAGVRELVRE